MVSSMPQHATAKSSMPQRLPVGVRWRRGGGGGGFAACRSKKQHAVACRSMDEFSVGSLLHQASQTDAPDDTFLFSLRLGVGNNSLRDLAMMYVNKTDGLQECEGEEAHMQ